MKEAGEYWFQLYSNDYAVLYIDGQRILESPSTSVGPLQFEAGDHEIMIRYRNTKSYSEMRLFWAPPGGSQPETIPTELLSPSFK